MITDKYGHKLQTNPIKVIRAKCLDCCANSSKEVSLCQSVTCELHPWRFGKNPYRKAKQLSDDERAALADRLRLAREINSANVD